MKVPVELVVCLSLFLFAGFAGCDDRPHTILVYGTADCPYTQGTMAELDARGLAYTFYDVREDAEKHDEMKAKVRDQLPGAETILYPVVDVWGIVLMRPSIEQIEAAMR